MNLLEVKKVHKNFGGVVALSDINFTIEKGAIIGLIGANGAGKTTLFSVLSGFYAPSKGAVLFKGEDITGKKPFEICRRGLARTFQVVKPFHNMSVLKNVTAGKLFGKDRIRDQKRAEQEAQEILDVVGLSQKASLPAKELTLADHKRLEVARTLATHPDLLLLDEVLAGLTQTEIVEAMEVVRRISSLFGVTVLMVEHVFKAVVGLCSRILVLHYGRMIAQGTPREITENPEVIEAYLGEHVEV